MWLWLVPHIPLRYLPPLFGYAAVGALASGLYGIVHDQVTYTVSPEYFTALKFHQFRYADFGLPPRILVAEIGFLATFWVGFAAAWFIARATVGHFPPAEARRYILRGFAMVLSAALLAGVVGYVWGAAYSRSADLADWASAVRGLGVSDLPAFVTVAYIHNAGYLGGLAGLVGAVVYVMRRRSLQHTQRMI
jgi:hypothetical protein